MFAKRDAKGQFEQMDDVGRSLSADRRQKAKTVAKSGHGDQEDRARGGRRRSSYMRLVNRPTKEPLCGSGGQPLRSDGMPSSTSMSRAFLSLAS